MTSLGRETGFAEAVSGAYEAGLGVSFAGLFAGERRRRVSLPTYPFQRERHWMRTPRRRPAAGLPLLGVRRDGPEGETSFETDLYADDPGWLSGHRVFGEVVAPGALYAAQALAALRETRREPGAALVDVQIQRPLMLSGEEARTVQVVLEPEDRWRVVSREGDGSAWDLHAEGRVAAASPAGAELDVETLRGGLAEEAPEAVYRWLAAQEIVHEGAFRSLTRLWTGPREALGEVQLPPGAAREGLAAHPALLDGCFQVLAGIGELSGRSGAWLPFGWERLWLGGPLPPRLLCHARIRQPQGELRKADLDLYGMRGEALGGVVGFTARRASRASLPGSRVDDLLHEVQWRDGPPVGRQSADFLSGPEALAAASPPLDAYLESEGLEPGGLLALVRELERAAQWFALRSFEELGWERRPGSRFTTQELRRRLKVTGDHRRLFGRLLALLAEAGVVAREPAGGWVVPAGPDQAAPEGPLAPEGRATSIEAALLRRCGTSLAEVLRGRADPLELLFGGEPGAADLYRESKAGRAVNRLVADAVGTAVRELPEGRRLRVLEVGAGTGATTTHLLASLPDGRTDYEFTDISAGFFAAAASRFRDCGCEMRYRALDIERDPAAQGFEPHRYDLVIAANVLHATRDLGETLAHCRALLAPSGMLVAVEGTRALGWQDLTFGLLPGWWRFEDEVRPEYPLAAPDVWRRVLADAGYRESALLGTEAGLAAILARAPEEVESGSGLFVLADGGALATELAAELSERRQTVLRGPPGGDREAWRSFFQTLPDGVPLRGVAHLAAVRGDGSGLSTGELAQEVELVGSGALSLVQGMTDAGVRPSAGIWFVSRGGQVLKRERNGTLSGSLLWGLGSVVDLEYGDLNARTLDLDPGSAPSAAELADELLFPDRETRIAWRAGVRRVSRLTRLAPRAELPAEEGYRLAAEPGGALDPLRVEEAPAAALAAGELRVAVEAAGVNFHDVMVAMRLVDVDQPLGADFCGRVVEAGPEVADFAPGDRVVGFAPGAFAPGAVSRVELVAPAPPGRSAAELATIPTAFVTAALAFEFAALRRGARVLVHAGTGGVGQAAIRLAREAGLVVHATASAPKQEYLRSLGVEGVFDSRDPGFGAAVLEATGGAGVDMVLNSLTGEDFIEASLSCLAPGGCFVEIGKRGIWSAERLAAARADVRYRVLAVDELLRREPERVGAVLREVLARVSSGELSTLPFTRWPLAEAGRALTRMREARHLGKLVLVPSAVATGGLRGDRSYLVTGGLGGIGLEVAGWLAQSGAGAIVLNGRRAPDERAAAVVEELRERGAEVRVEIADVTDGAAVAGMLRRVDAELPPLAGVIHSVGVLSDGALTNQDWGRFEEVLRPKVLGAWRLHRATLDRELDLFVLFSSATGVLGNAGQANHAAANAFLDQLARHRRSLNLPGQAIAWGAWSGVGEAEEQRERVAGRLAAGVGWLTPKQGLRAFDRLLREEVPVSVVAPVDWAAFAAGVPRVPELISELGEAGRATVAEGEGEHLATRLEESPPAERERLIVEFVREEVRALLRLPDLPEPDVGFFDLGMDSLMAVELRNRVNRALGGVHEVPTSVVFDFASPARLAGRLHKVLEAARAEEDGREGTGPAEPASPAAAPAAGESLDDLLSEIRATLGDAAAEAGTAGNGAGGDGDG